MEYTLNIRHPYTPPRVVGPTPLPAHTFQLGIHHNKNHANGNVNVKEEQGCHEPRAREVLKRHQLLGSRAMVLSGQTSVILRGP
eukprot:5013108-Pyramimonas_sp.AAC.2